MEAVYRLQPMINEFQGMCKTLKQIKHQKAAAVAAFCQRTVELDAAREDYQEHESVFWHMTSQVYMPSASRFDDSPTLEYRSRS